MRMPVGARPMRLQASDDAHREFALSRLGMVSTTCRCGTGARSEVSSHCVQSASRLAWQLGQK